VRLQFWSPLTSNGRVHRSPSNIMSDKDFDVPPGLKRRMRKLFLAQLEPSTVDVFELELFDWYLKETEMVVSGMLAAECEDMRQQTARGVEDVNDSGIVAAEYYIKRIRYSHVIYLTSLLETCLERACSVLRTAIGEENVLFELDDLSGDQWSKKRKFLERYGRFELPSDCWYEIEVLTAVRNCLVHDNGNPSGLSQKARKAIGQRPGIYIEEYELRIEEAFVRHSHEAIRSFVHSVEERLKEVVQRAQRPRSVR